MISGDTGIRQYHSKASIWLDEEQAKTSVVWIQAVTHRGRPLQCFCEVLGATRIPVLWRNLTVLTEHSHEEEARKSLMLKIERNRRTARVQLDVYHVI
jgi:hypothetical protein